MDSQDVNPDRKTMEGLMTTSNNSSTNNNSNKNANQVKDVLFQKIGNTWFIFSEINNEIVYSVMPQGMDPKSTKLELFNIIEDHMTKVASQKRRGPEASVA